MEDEVIFEGFSAQDRFAQAFFSGKYNRLLIAGSIRSGKTFVCIALLLVLCKIFPRSKWLIVRKDWPRLRSTTMEVFNRLCPQSFVKKKFNPLTREVVFKNDSRILFMNEAPGIDKDQPFRGLYINGAFTDEGNELATKTVDAIISRLGSHKESFALNADTGEKVMPPVFLMMSANPNQGWMKEKYYLPSQNGTLSERQYFQNITIEENPYITEEDMKEFADWPEELLNKFIKGSWDALDEPKQLIKWAYINKCEAVLPDESEDYYLGVDVARQGGDKLVYVLYKGSNVYSIEEQAYTDSLMTIVERIEWYHSEYRIPADDIVIDSVGIGQGVVDRLHQKGIYVYSFVGNAAATTDPWSTAFQYRNLKAQGYWTLKEKMKDGKIGGITHQTLKSELASIWVYTDEKEIGFDSKEKYRTRNGKSPDFADAMMYATWARWKHEFQAPIELFTVG